MAITFRQIDAFRAVMLAGTAVGAAKMLGISQPAISRLIADLERDIGYPLFERDGRRIRPTAKAQLLMEEVRRALIGLEQIRDAAIEIGRLGYARLRLVSIPSVASTIAVDLIDRFAAENEETFVSLEVQSSDSALEWVISQQCDLGIAAVNLESAAIESRVVEVGASVCILPRGHRLAGAERIVPEMLEGESFVSFRPDSIFRREVDAIFEAAGVSRRMIFEARTSDTVRALVATGRGVAIVGPLALSRGAAEDGDHEVVVRPFVPAPAVALSIMWPAQRALSAPARAFLAVAGKVFGVALP